MEKAKKKPKMTLDKLATFMMGHFSTIEADITTIKHDVFELKNNDTELHRKVSRIEADIADMKDEHITRDEFEDHGARIKLIEKHLHIVSGK